MEEGEGSGGIVDATSIVETINGAIDPLSAVGMAVLGIAASIMVYRLVRSVVGR